ncbi:MAG: hypothetical protein V4665_01755 [Patescibacteria group bacterium]
MNKQEFIEKIKASSLSEESKGKIISLLSEKELNFETKEEIKDIIQTDIEASTQGITTAEDDQEIATVTTQLSDELSTLEKDLTQDMEVVENEMKDLATMASDLDKIADHAEIDQIKNSI